MQMGGVLGKRCAHPYKKSNDLKQRIRQLEDELLDLRCKREKEISMHEHEARLFMGKEAKWKRARKRWRKEVKRLKSRLEEKDEVIEVLEERRGDQACTVKEDKAQWQLLGATVLVEQMREEQELREEAVEKWKGLYLAIKAELDDLILRTHNGKMLFLLKSLLSYTSKIRNMLSGSSCLDGQPYSAVESSMNLQWELQNMRGDSQRLWLTSSEVDVMEGLQRALQAKEESVEALRARVVGLEKEVTNRERQMDMMRQSLRILSDGKTGQPPRRSHSRSFWRKSRARK